MYPEGSYSLSDTQKEKVQKFLPKDNKYNDNLINDNDKEYKEKTQKNNDNEKKKSEELNPEDRK